MAKDHPLLVGVDEKTCTITCPDQHAHRLDTFGWVCNNGELEVQFNKNGTPFQNGEDDFTAPVHQRTRPAAIVDPQAALRGYSYSIKITLPTGKVCTADPQILIDGDIFDAAQSIAGEKAFSDADDAVTSALNALDDISSNLSGVASVAAMANPPLFFPNKIELISVDVKVKSLLGSAAELSVEVAGQDPQQP
jgi:hypothetical protein